MCIYGLSIYLETTKTLRKGSFHLMVISLVIFVISTIATALDVWFQFEVLLLSGTAGSDYVRDSEAHASRRAWYVATTTGCMVTYIGIGDCLLVRRN